jgi:hypothetical protein
MSAMRPVPETRDWHVTPVPKQLPDRQPQFNPHPHTTPLPPVGQHQGAVPHLDLNKVYNTLKQLQDEFRMPLAHSLFAVNT